MTESEDVQYRSNGRCTSNKYLDTILLTFTSVTIHPTAGNGKASGGIPHAFWLSEVEKVSGHVLASIHALPPVIYTNPRAQSIFLTNSVSFNRRSGLSPETLHYGKLRHRSSERQGLANTFPCQDLYETSYAERLGLWSCVSRIRSGSRGLVIGSLVFGS